jgi:ABC-type glycerol-3-phosphate transport system permease component
MDTKSIGLSDPNFTKISTLLPLQTNKIDEAGEVGAAEPKETLESGRGESFRTIGDEIKTREQKEQQKGAKGKFANTVIGLFTGASMAFGTIFGNIAGTALAAHVPVTALLKDMANVIFSSKMVLPQVMHRIPMTNATVAAAVIGTFVGLIGFGYAANKVGNLIANKLQH